MPRLSDSMEEGVISHWLVADGDVVSIGQEIAEVETDKATMSYTAEAAGRITLLAAEGDTVAVGAPIAELRDPGASGPTAGRGDDSQSDARANGARRANASPVARRLAADLGVDISVVVGTGPGGRVVKADVRGAHALMLAQAPEESRQAPSRAEPAAGAAAVAAAAAAEPNPAPSVAEQVTGAPPATADAKGRVTVRPLTRSQQLVARRMSESKATAPDFVVSMDVDMEAVTELREQLRGWKDGDAVLPSFNDFVVKACGLALREHPLANGSYQGDEIRVHQRFNVGIAVAAPGALIVPTIFDADQKSLGEIARSARALVAKVRDGSITPPELSGGTFSISNLGMFGVDAFTAVLNPPQAAILAVGSVTPRAVVRDGALTARRTMSTALTCDHRILYGADAAAFLADVRKLLQNPISLLL
jgi:pyruvate dehydrogenase E2 component (dihydrolipoamide acetyltransferase)